MKEMPNYVTKQQFFLLLQCYSYKSMQSCNVLIQMDFLCCREQTQPNASEVICKSTSKIPSPHWRQRRKILYTCCHLKQSHPGWVSFYKHAVLTSQFCRWSISPAGSSGLCCWAQQRVTCHYAGSAGSGLVLEHLMGRAPSPPGNSLAGSCWG